MVSGGFKMWVYEKVRIPRKYQDAESENGEIYYNSIRWTRWRVRRVFRYQIEIQRANKRSKQSSMILELRSGTLEIVGSIVHQHKGVPADIPKKVLEPITNHDHAVYPVSASGVPFWRLTFNQRNPIADLYEDLVRSKSKSHL